MRCTTVMADSIGIFLFVLNDAINENMISRFLPFLLRDDAKYGVHPESLGFYVGLLGSGYFLLQCLSNFLWSQLAGRASQIRRLIVFGMGGTVLGNLVFILAPSYEWALAARCLTGFLDGTSVLGPMYISKTRQGDAQVRGFSLMNLGYGVGSILAAALGSFVYTTQYRQLFPCLSSILMALVAMIYCSAWMRATDVPAATGTATALGEIVSADPDREKPPVSLPRRQIVSALVCYGLTFFIWVLYDAMFVVFANTDLDQGGLGLTKNTIGALLSVAAFGRIVFQIGVYDPLVRRPNNTPLSIYRRLCLLGLVFLLLIPALNPALQSAASAQESHGFIRTCVLMVFMMLFRGLVSSSIVVSIMMHINKDMTQDMKRVSTFNGIIGFLASLAKFGGNLGSGYIWTLATTSVHTIPSPMIRTSILFWVIAGINVVNCVVALFT